MKREGDLSSLTDGKLYRSSDMARLGCNDCEGCSACCKGMGNSVVLDPYDVWRLTRGLGITFAEMIGNQIMLSVVDGLILPSLNMDSTGVCPFLNEEGRCSIHAIRPGICRLFPLGRVYENEGFKYFLQIHECKNENRTKLKVKKWIDTPDLKQNDAFILAWHDFVCDIQAKMMQITDDELFKKINMFLLQQFYMERYHEENFYQQFEERLTKAKQVVDMLLSTK